MTVVDLIIAPFEYQFMRRALVGSLALAVSAGPIGVVLMLRRLALTGDAMAHGILPGVAVGYLMAGLSLPAMTVGGLAAGLTVAVLAALVARATRLREDASLAVFYLISLALGVAIVSMKGSNIDLMRVLFGSVLALDNASLVMMASIASLSLVVFAALLRPLLLDCIDPGFLRSVSPSGGAAHVMFLGLVVLNLVAGFQALGTLLAVGLMILPAASARFWSNEVTGMMIIAAGLGAGSAFGGLLLSYHADMPAGPAIVLVAGGFYGFSLCLGSTGGLIIKLLPRRHLEA